MSMPPNLVDLCLNSVAENLAKHHLDFTSSDDFCTERKLQFLQRKYSSDLISRLYTKEGGLPEESIDIVVNKHTKYLDTRWFKKCRLDRLSSKIADIGCNLEKIYCDPEGMDDDNVFEFSEAVQDYVCLLTNLKSFTFHECDDLILKNIAKFCPHIEEIDVHGSWIASEGVRSLCRNRKGRLLCTKLKKLRLGENESIKDKDLEYLLKNVPSLEEIGHPNLPGVLYSLHKENLPSLDKVVPYNITTLDLMSRSDPRILSHFGDIVKVCASVCPRLKDFSCFLMNQEQVNCLFNLPDVDKLCIGGDEINIDSFLIAKGSQLTSLTILYCRVSIPVLAEKCPRLRELIMVKANLLCDKDSKPVFNSLSSLRMNDDERNGEKIALMLSSSSFIQLESLSFSYSDLESPEVKAAILKCCEVCPVKNVVLKESPVEKQFIENLLRTCHTLDHLTLDGCLNRFCQPINRWKRKDLLNFAKLLPNKPEISVIASGFVYDTLSFVTDDNSDVD